MLKTIPRHELKILAVATVLGLAAAGTASIPARADTIRTNCLGDNCVRVRCDDWGDRCVRIGYFPRDDIYRSYPAHYVCDAYGDDCHWTHAPVYYEDRDSDDYGG